MKQVVTRGIVLSRTNFGEADKILTVLTADQGKVRLMAKGVRKIKSKLAGGIELFCVSQLSYIIGKGDIYTITSSRLEQNFSNIVKDINRTNLGYNFLKYTNKITEDAPEPQYYTVLKTALSGLDNMENPSLTKLWLGMQLLKLGGHSPNLKTDIKNSKLVESQHYNFDMQAMAFSPGGQVGPYKAKHIKLLRLAQNIDNPGKLGVINGADEIVDSCNRLVDLMLRQFTRL